MGCLAIKKPKKALNTPDKKKPFEPSRVVFPPISLPWWWEDAFESLLAIKIDICEPLRLEKKVQK